MSHLHVLNNAGRASQNDEISLSFRNLPATHWKWSCKRDSSCRFLSIPNQKSQVTSAEQLERRATMASSNSESTPLIPPTPFSAPPRIRGHKNVTFNPDPTSSTAPPASPRLAQSRPASASHPIFPTPQIAQGQPMLSALNSKLRRRNSHGSPLGNPAMTPATASKIGPQRTTKNAQKLKLLPNPDMGDEGPDEESGRDVYSQFTRIKDPTARRDAARLGKADRDRLPRVTAYCTANSYRLDGLMKFLKSRGKTRGSSPKQFDECIYSPFKYRESKSSRRRSSGASDTGGEDTLNGSTSTTPNRDRRKSDSAIEIGEVTQSRREELMDLATTEGDAFFSSGESSMIPTPVAAERMERADPETLLSSDNPDMDTAVHTPEVFLFEYGTVVIWGMTLAHEQRFLKDIARFETEKLSNDDVQTEDFNFYYTREYQARIYNDFISLREKRNYMTKLAISHALAQSVKVIFPSSPFSYPPYHKFPISFFVLALSSSSHFSSRHLHPSLRLYSSR